MKLTAKQYEQIGVAIKEARLKAPTFQAEMEDSGRAAVAAVAPLLLAEPGDDELRKVGSVRLWDAADFGRCKAVFRDRLASVTAKPDPAVEAVKHLADGWCMEVRDSAGNEAFIREVVAAVDKARGK